MIKKLSVIQSIMEVIFLDFIKKKKTGKPWGQTAKQQKIKIKNPLTITIRVRKQTYGIFRSTSFNTKPAIFTKELGLFHGRTNDMLMTNQMPAKRKKTESEQS